MSFLDKLKDRLEEVKTAGADILHGDFVEPEVKENRLNICNSCEHLFKPTSSCKKCGCFMIAKTSLKHARCPIGKWY